MKPVDRAGGGGQQWEGGASWLCILSDNLQESKESNTFCYYLEMG